MLEPSMLMGLTLRMMGLSGRGVLARLSVSETGEGKSAFALVVGESGVGKPGYFLPISVKRERLGRMAWGCGEAVFKLLMLRTGGLPLRCVVARKSLIEPSKEGW